MAEAARPHCPSSGLTHIVVAISTTIMERGIHSPKQLNTVTTWRRHVLCTVLSPIPTGVQTPGAAPRLSSP